MPFSSIGPKLKDEPRDMTTMTIKHTVFISCFSVLFSGAICAQTNTSNQSSPRSALSHSEADQVSAILGLTAELRRIKALQTQHGCDAVSSPEELTLRQQLLESVETAELDVDGAIGEIDNERGELGNLQTSLKASRDKTVAQLNAAALITGSGAGAAVNATQFTTLSSRTNNIGDGIGVGSGVASTILAYLATRKQHGPSGSVSNTPNMLAPLFDRSPVLNTDYPQTVMQYLQSVPPAESPERGTRLEQLKAEWGKAGRLDLSNPAKEQKKIIALTTSGDKGVTVSIDDLTDRMAMLGDVSGRIALMKRDLALLMRSLKSSSVCFTQHL